MVTARRLRSLQREAGAALRPEEVVTLHDRTERWPAGLYLPRCACGKVVHPTGRPARSAVMTSW